MSSLQQNIISFVIILLVIAFIAWIGQKPPLEPVGIVSLKPTASVEINKTLTAQQVGLYDYLPANAETLGEVTAELALDPNKTEQEQSEHIAEYVRTLAANAGANGIVVQLVVARGHVIYFSGKLIRV